MRHKADRNGFLSAFSGTLRTSCMKKNSYEMDDVLRNGK